MNNNNIINIYISNNSEDIHSNSDWNHLDAPALPTTTATTQRISYFHPLQPHHGSYHRTTWWDKDFDMVDIVGDVIDTEKKAEEEEEKENATNDIGDPDHHHDFDDAFIYVHNPNSDNYKSYKNIYNNKSHNINDHLYHGNPNPNHSSLGMVAPLFVVPHIPLAPPSDNACC
jgi:hypothetical protein